MNRDPKVDLTDLRKLPTETEWVEFKPASGIDLHKLGCYFSALSNEARLHSREYGWIVFGVDDETHDIVGTHYKDTPESLDKLKLEITQDTTNGIGFLAVYEVFESGKRVLMFSIPPAPYGMPIAWKNKFYGRDGSSLGDLKQDEIDRIRDLKKIDWSAGVCDKASLENLDPVAIALARQKYVEKFPESRRTELAKEVADWSDETFLKKAGVLSPDGQVTRTAILLLGKPESAYYLSPADAQISWVLFDDAGAKKDYEHFSPPYLVNVDRLFAKIRNLNYRYMPRNTLFPTEIQQYDNWVLREALNNAIAHQDYALGGRITVKEYSDHIVCTNLGGFFADNVAAFAEGNHVPDRYRNPWLCSAMFNFNMIDKVGSGISRMIDKQRRRFFPLPEWEAEQDKVAVTVHGKILDENFTELLMQNSDLDLKTVLALDKVQKRKHITEEQIKHLKSLKLLEGRKPNYIISSSLADMTGKKLDYLKHRSIDTLHFEHLILTCLNKFPNSTRKEIDSFLLEKIPNFFSEKQKKIKVNNLLNRMANQKSYIKNMGARSAPKWAITELGKKALIRLKNEGEN